MQVIKGVLFDKDGTLFDFDKTWGGWAQAFLLDLAKGDAAFASRMAAALRFDLKAAKFHPDSPVIAGTPEEGVRLILPMLPDWEFDALLAHSNATAARAPLAPVLPLVPFLQGLAASGLVLGVATNDAENSARAHLSAVEAEPLFDVILGSDSGYGGKPEPGMCLGFAQLTGLAPRDIVMVGDSLHDLHSGAAAGMRGVGVLTGPARRGDLEDHAEVVLESIAELPNWIAAQAD
jgi:phosphoglycolate phosphatase